MTTHSSILVWRSPWTEEPGELQSTGCRELDTTEATKHAQLGWNCSSPRRVQPLLRESGRVEDSPGRQGAAQDASETLCFLCELV